MSFLVQLRRLLRASKRLATNTGTTNGSPSLPLERHDVGAAPPVLLITARHRRVDDQSTSVDLLHDVLFSCKKRQCFCDLLKCIGRNNDVEYSGGKSSQILKKNRTSQRSSMGPQPVHVLPEG